MPSLQAITKFIVMKIFIMKILIKYSGLELRKKYRFVKKILTIFNFNVQPHGLRNYVLSSFNLAHLTLDRETDRYHLC